VIRLLPMLAITIAAQAAEPVLPLPHRHAGAEELESDPDVRWGRLDNGLGDAVRATGEPEGKASLRLFVNAGSLHEAEDVRGIAHYLEHMAFNGSEHFPPGQLVERLQPLGIAFGRHTNAHTSFDETVYKLELPDTEAETMDLGLVVMADWAGGLSIIPEEVDKERGIIMAEMRDRDNHNRRTWRALYRALYPGTVIGHRFPIGVKETVESIDADDLRGFYQSWYRPENCFLAVVGDFQVDDIEARLREHLSGWSMDGELRSQPPLEGLDADPLRVLAHHESEAERTMVWLFRVAAEERPIDSLQRRRQSLRRSLASSVLSRRLTAIAESGPEAPIRGGGAGIDRDFGYRDAALRAVARDGRVLDTVALLERESRRLLEHGPTASELQAVSAEYIAALEQAVEQKENRSSRGLAGALYVSVREGVVFQSPEQRLALGRQLIDEIRPEHLQQAWAEATAAEHLLVAVTGREDLGADAEKQIRQAWQRSVAEPVAAPEQQAVQEWAYHERPAPGEAVADERLSHGIRRLRFANNAVVNILARDAKPNQVLFTLRLQLPHEPEQPGLREFAGKAFRSAGLGAHSATELRDVLAGSKVQIGGPRFRGSAAEVSGSCTPEELELSLQLMRAYLTDPGWRSEAFERAQSAWLESLAAEPTDLGATFARHWNLLTTHGLPQRRAATLPEAQALTMDAVREWLAPVLANAAIELSIVGDVDEEQAAALSAAYLGSLSERRPLRVTPELAAPGALQPVPAIMSGDHRVTVDASVRRAIVRLAWQTDDSADIHRARRLRMLAGVVSELLRKQLREELGEAYSPYASASSSDTYDGHGVFSMTVSVDAGRQDAVVPVLYDLITQLHEEGVSEELLTQVKEPSVRGLPAYLDGNGYWRDSVLAQSASQPERLRWADDMLEDYQAISAAELSALARSYLDRDQAVLLIAVSEGGEQQADAAEAAAE